MAELTAKRQINRMVFLFTLTYMISYITRINYGAVISEMVDATGLTKSMLSLAVTASFVTYGAGQIISGICGDKISPKRLVFIGLLVTCLMNLLIPFCHNHYQMAAVWSVNGAAQAFMWPPIIKLISELFSSEAYSSASVKVSWGSSFGTIVVYLISPVLITLFGWKSVFIFSASIGLIMAFVWNKYCIDVKIDTKPAQQTKAGRLSFFSPLIICIMIVNILQGMLRDGVTTWMPSYITETYNLNSSISILTGVILPIFGILSFQIASKLYEKKLTNPLKCAGVFWGTGTIFALVLWLFTGSNAPVSVLCSAALTGCMHGVNLMLICMVPAFFKKSGNVSTASGVLNSCTYAGSAISTYGIAVLSENTSWSFTLFLWTVIAALGTVICLLLVKAWNRFAN